MIDAAPQLRVIGRSGVGVERVDLDAATRRGIPVVVTPNGGTRGVAEGALALMLHLVKRLGPLTAVVADGRWREREAVPVGDLDGATLAVIGYGRIGRRVAELARALRHARARARSLRRRCPVRPRGGAWRGGRDQPARAADGRDARA